MADVTTVVSNIDIAREAAEESDYASSIAYYESALASLSKHVRNVSDPNALGKLREMQKRANTELELVRELNNEVLMISGGTPAGPGPGRGYDNSMDDSDPLVWRPPSRGNGDGRPLDFGGPVRVQARGGMAPAARPRASDDRGGGLPNWAGNNGSNNNQRAVGNSNGAGPSGRAGSVPRARPGAPANSAGNARGGPPAPAGNSYEKPWRKGMVNNEPPQQGGQAGKAKKKPEYIGPDADLAQNLERELLDTAPGIRWTDIAGLTEAKRVLEEAAVLPLIMPEYFTGIRRPFKGVMLFGPPGTGKTMLAKAVATETGCAFFNVSSATLASKYRGESERMVRCLFDLARMHGPSIIFIDEVDSLCSQRGAQGEHEASRRVKTELLTQVDGCHTVPEGEEGEPPKRVMVLAATNFPWDIDEAMRRRLEKRIYIPLPGPEECVELLKINLKDVILHDGVSLETIAQKLNGYSGDDITNICRDAAMNGMRRNIAGKSPAELKKLKELGQDLAKEPVMMEDFLQAMKRINPSVGPADIKKHEAWRDEFGSA